MFSSSKKLKILRKGGESFFAEMCKIFLKASYLTFKICEQFIQFSFHSNLFADLRHKSLNVQIETVN